MCEILHVGKYKLATTIFKYFMSDENANASFLFFGFAFLPLPLAGHNDLTQNVSN